VVAHPEVAVLEVIELPLDFRWPAAHLTQSLWAAAVLEILAALVVLLQAMEVILCLALLHQLAAVMAQELGIPASCLVVPAVLEVAAEDFPIVLLMAAQEILQAPAHRKVTTVVAMELN
jgi:hypothetical protein